MQDTAEHRELTAAYTFRGLVTGWACSVCKKPFHIPLEQATDVLAAPAEIQEEFARHICVEAQPQAQAGN